jgi:hypothetical protein
MSYISNTLDELLAVSKLTAAGLARAGAVSAAHISRIRSGIQIWVSPEELTALSKAFAKHIEGTHSHSIHAQLLLARLKDECAGPGAAQINIALKSKVGKSAACESAPTKKPALPPRMQQNLDLIADHITDCRHVRDLVETTANLCRNAHSTQR